MKFKYLLTFLIVLITDQVIKRIVIENFSYTLNSGITFGFLDNLQFVSIALNIILLALLVLLIKSGNFAKFNIILVSILAAGCSNFLDRIFYGGVVDYIQVSVFPLFNFADIVITLGIILIVFSFALNEYKEISGRKSGPGKETGSISGPTQ